MAGKLTKTQLKKHLAHLEQKELVEEIAHLFAAFKEVKQYYQIQYSSEIEHKEFLEAYKQKIKSEFYTKIGMPLFPKAAKLRKLITDFKNISPSKYHLIDLILYRTELAVKFSSKFGDMDESFYEATINAYNDAIKLIAKEKLSKEFYPRAYDIVYNSRDTGWGFHDDLKEIYEEVYGDFFI